MPTNSNFEVIVALRNFIRAIDPQNNDPSTLVGNELAAGQNLLSALERMMDQKIKNAPAKPINVAF